MNKQSTFSKRQFLLTLGSSIGSLGGVSLLSGCADLGQLGGLGGLSMGDGLSPTLLIKPQTIVSKLAPHFPYRKNYQSLAGVSFDDPVVSMVPNAEKVRVGLTTLAGLNGVGQQIGGRCQLACGLRYDPESRGIYLKDATLEDFSFNGANSQLTSGFASVANSVGNTILERYPIYSLANYPGAGLLKNMNVTNEGIALGFGLV
ncbi:DUF1439 domain-containing protein [Akkermansiaceae bacterium]|nr:DUF1439 domain-containing protein [Akkermansiaceae bacterium]